MIVWSGETGDGIEFDEEQESIANAARGTTLYLLSLGEAKCVFKKMVTGGNMKRYYEEMKATETAQRLFDIADKNIADNGRCKLVKMTVTKQSKLTEVMIAVSSNGVVLKGTSGYSGDELETLMATEESSKALTSFLVGNLLDGLKGQENV